MPVGPATFFGQELAHRRKALGWSQAKLAGEAHMTQPRIAQLEKASIPPTLDNAKDVDGALGETAPGFFERYWRFMDTAPLVADWFARYVELEGQAVSISEYAATFVPGLLQTGAYARSLLRAGQVRREDASEIEMLVAARLHRQQILQREDPPPIWYVIDEVVLTRPVGGSAVMAEQLGYMHELAVSDRVAIQVIPVSIGAHPLLGGQLSLLTLPDGPNVAYLEGMALGQLVEDTARVAHYGLLYDHLQTLALDPKESAAMIRLAQEDMIKMSKTQQHDMTGAEWEKSSYSNQQGQACVEVAKNMVPRLGALPVRDSKNPEGPALIFPASSWSSFVQAAKADAFR